MKKFFAKIKSANQDGSVLLAVLTIMTFASVLAATAFSFVQTANTRSLTNVREEQAYYTASTCLESFIDTIMTPDSDEWKMFEQIANGGGGTSSEIDLQGMGKCVIDVEKPTGMSYIKVTATATVDGGESDSVVCYLKTTTVPTSNDLKNAVEVVGSGNASQNNIHVVGPMSKTQDDPNAVFGFTNDSVIYGKYFQYGSAYIGTHIHLKESVNDDGTSFTVSKYLGFCNEVKLQPNMVKGDDNKTNFICAGGAIYAQNQVTLGTDSDMGANDIRTGAMDIYAGGIILNAPNENVEFVNKVSNELTNINNANGDGFKMPAISSNMNGFTQYGNVYCYSTGGTNTGGGTNELNAGNFVVGNVSGPDAVKIYGDVYIEGNLFLSENDRLNVYGNLYVLGNIEGNGTVRVMKDVKRTSPSGHAYVSSTSIPAGKAPITAETGIDTNLTSATFSTVKSTPRGTIPTLEYEGTKYVYNPEDLLVSTDEKVSTISSTYKAMVTNPGNFSIDKFDAYDDPETGVHFDKRITSSCYIKSNDISPQGKNDKILIEVDSNDVVIVFEDGCWLQGNDHPGEAIIVRNKSKENEGSTTGLKPHFCYFTLDVGIGTVTLNYKTDASGNPVTDSDGNKIVESTTPGADFKKNAKITANNAVILDYDLWKEVKLSVNVLGYAGTKPLNLTNNDISGTYKVGIGYNVFLLPEGCTLESQNNMLLQMTIYGPKATVHCATPGLELDYVTGNDMLTNKYENAKAFVIGSVIAGEYLGGTNDSYVLYSQPSSSSNLGNVSGASKKQDGGYEVIKYTKDLS